MITLNELVAETRFRVLNTEVYFTKEIADVDLKPLVARNTTVIITDIEASQLRDDCICLEFSFKDFSGATKECKLYWESVDNLKKFLDTTFLTREKAVS